jgi:hypothetical protein
MLICVLALLGFIVGYVLMFEFYLKTDYVYYDAEGRSFMLIEKGMFMCLLGDRLATYRIPTYKVFFMSKSLL